MSVITEGTKLPSGTLHESNPGNQLSTSTLFSAGRHIIFGVPGAFTPGCHKTHLPGYIQDYSKYTSKGIDSISCVSVNDAFVMAAWGESVGADGKVRMLADPTGEWLRQMGLVFDATPLLGNERAKRFSLVVEDGVVKRVNVEEDNTGLTCSLSNVLFDQL
ncbi:Redoxin [Saitoella complicata NRRL Y-17804]|uniref:Redoxin n=1 Tax=Saitoella complicata (strain BCRC 22490 / CBS 7301 / JCM 7358 / NBRC 10748 / NRRL Y-17804) TaxID=698492 RepID=UPI0008677C5F|nr:Redoxin [Saitoella complicata NRRL Y-17804]ODQ55185.1 Redoxin [Saitoella complicata NRRL Y-17804]